MRKKIGFTGQTMRNIELKISPDIVGAEKVNNKMEPLILKMVISNYLN